jgi:hypothetical protein
VKSHLFPADGVATLRERTLPAFNGLLLFFGDAVEVAGGRLRGLDSADEAGVAQTDSIVGVGEIVEVRSGVASAEPSWEKRYLTRMSSPPGCSTKKSLTL